MKRPLLDPRIKTEGDWRATDAQLETCRDKIERSPLLWITALVVVPFGLALLVCLVSLRWHP